MMKNESDSPAARGAEPLMISSNAPSTNPPIASIDEGSGSTPRKESSRRNVTVMSTIQMAASMRLTATAGSRNRRATYPAVSRTAGSTTQATVHQPGASTRRSGSIAASSAR